jgi:hypothetical protein
MAAPLPGGGDEVTLEIVHDWNLGKAVGDYLRRAKKRCIAAGEKVVSNSRVESGQG